MYLPSLPMSRRKKREDHKEGNVGYSVSQIMRESGRNDVGDDPERYLTVIDSEETISDRTRLRLTRKSYRSCRIQYDASSVQSGVKL